MKDAPAFDFYPERWTHGTRHMTKEERCDYLDLLCHQWTDDGIAGDLNLVARLIGHKNGSKISPFVLEKFPLCGDGKRRNRRLELEREKQRGRIQKRREGAEKTNAKRWGSDSLSDRSATSERHLSDIGSDSPPPTTHHSPLIKDINEVAPDSAIDPLVPLATVLANCGQIGATPEVAENWWLSNDARGWRDRNGQPIANWQSSLKSYANACRANDAQRKASPATQHKTFAQMDKEARDEARHGPEALKIKLI